MTMDRIEDVVADMVREAVADKMSCIRLALCGVFAPLLWEIKLECEKAGGVGDIEDLISHVISTAMYRGPEHAQYSSFDKDDPEYKARLERVKTALASHGIKGSWKGGCDAR